MKLGYLVAAALVAAAAAVWFALPFGGELGQRIVADTQAVVRLDAGRPYAVWTADRGTPSCEMYPAHSLDPAFDPRFVKESDPGFTLEADGRTWYGELLVRPRWTGPHTVTCDRDGGIGAAPWGHSGRARALTLAAAVGLLLSGAAVAVVTARRERRSHRPLS